MTTYRERNQLSVLMFDAQREVAKVAKANSKAIKLAGITSLVNALAKWDKASKKVSLANRDEGDWDAFMALEGFPDS